MKACCYRKKYILIDDPFTYSLDLLLTFSQYFPSIHLVFSLGPSLRLVPKSARFGAEYIEGKGPEKVRLNGTQIICIHYVNYRLSPI